MNSGVSKARKGRPCLKLPKPVKEQLLEAVASPSAGMPSNLLEELEAILIHQVQDFPRAFPNVSTKEDCLQVCIPRRQIWKRQLRAIRCLRKAPG